MLFKAVFAAFWQEKDEISRLSYVLCSIRDILMGQPAWDTFINSQPLRYSGFLHKQILSQCHN